MAILIFPVQEKYFFESIDKKRYTMKRARKTFLLKVLLINQLQEFKLHSHLIIKNITISIE